MTLELTAPPLCLPNPRGFAVFSTGQPGHGVLVTDVRPGPGRAGAETGCRRYM